MPPDLENIKKDLAEQRAMIEKIFVSVEKTRKYFLWVLIITVAAVVLPMLGLLFAVPSFISTYTTTLQGL